MSSYIKYFQSENTEFVTKEYFLKFLEKQSPDGVLDFMRDLHFHPDRPENHNICVTNLSKNKILRLTEIGAKTLEGKDSRDLLRRYITILKHDIRINYDNFKKLFKPTEEWDLYIEKITKIQMLEIYELKPFFKLLHEYKHYSKSIKSYYPS